MEKNTELKSKPATTDEYLATVPDQAKEKLEKIRQIVKEVAPDATEAFSYMMPAFTFHGIFVWYAAFKNHYSLFAPRVLSTFKDELTQYETTKSAIRIPMNEPVPVELVSKIVAYAAKVNLEQEQLKPKKKR